MIDEIVKMLEVPLKASMQSQYPAVRALLRGFGLALRQRKDWDWRLGSR